MRECERVGEIPVVEVESPIKVHEETLRIVLLNENHCFALRPLGMVTFCIVTCIEAVSATKQPGKEPVAHENSSGVVASMTVTWERVRLDAMLLMST